MEQKLKDMLSHKDVYTPSMNILMNNRSKDWYSEIGKHICETMDISRVPELSSLVDRVKTHKKNILTRIIDWSGQGEKTMANVTIFFITSALNAESLRNMFGEPLYHDEFGEGFEGEYDEETDEYGEPEIKESYASYFVEVGGERLHIGYDHRGTGIEFGIKKEQKSIDAMSTDETAQRCARAIMKLADLYAEKNL